MKKPANVADLTASLTAAATAPLVPRPEEAPAEPATRRKKANISVPVFLRVPKGIYDRYDAEAMARTKATGKGVSVQQIMIERLGDEP